MKPLFYNTKPLEFITLYLFQVSFKQKGEVKNVGFDRSAGSNQLPGEAEITRLRLAILPKGQLSTG